MNSSEIMATHLLHQAPPAADIPDRCMCTCVQSLSEKHCIERHLLVHTGETFKPHRDLELDSQSFLCHVWPISFVFFITIIDFSSQITVWSSVTGPIVVVKVHLCSCELSPGVFSLSQSPDP